MPEPNVRRAFIALHVTLGLVVLLQSLGTALAVSGLRPASSPNGHVLALAGVESLGALLFLWRPAARLGGTVLLVIGLQG